MTIGFELQQSAVLMGSFFQERRILQHTYVVEFVSLGKNFPFTSNHGKASLLLTNGERDVTIHMRAAKRRQLLYCIGDTC